LAVGTGAHIIGGTAACRVSSAVLLLGVPTGQKQRRFEGHSAALLADATHSFGDALLAAAVWAALLWSQRPPDPEHPYGHARAKAVAGSSVALLLALSALAAGWQSVRALLGPAPGPPAGYTLAVAAASFLLNEWLYRRNRRVARLTGSAALAAASWDQRLDALTALAVLLALALVRVGGPAWRLADPVAGLGVALVILVADGRLLRSSVHELMDAQADPAVVGAVRREALAVAGVRGVEKLLVRKAGLEFLVDIHVEVDPAQTVAGGHAIAHAVTDRLVGALAAVRGVLVHIEPARAPGAPAGRGREAPETDR
jgi:cation diffusion facilitator family transporter